MPEVEVNQQFGETLQVQTTDYDQRKRKRISIDVADMQIALEEFKKNVIRKNFASPFLGLIGVWLPFISSDFKALGKYSADSVEGMYLIAALTLTFVILKSWIWPIPWSKKETSKNITTSDSAELAKILHDQGIED